jgi:hypothetical protein
MATGHGLRQNLLIMLDEETGHGAGHAGGHSSDGHNGCCDDSCHGHANGNGHGSGHSHSCDHDHGGHSQHDHGGHSHGRARSSSLGCGGQEGAGSIWKDTNDWLRAHDPAECEAYGPCHVATADCADAGCDHSMLNSTTNVIAMVRANELIAMSRVNAILAITAVLYISVNLVCCILNSYDNDCYGEPHCDAATSAAEFHLLEFWSAFIFNTVDVFAISYSPKNLSNQYSNPTLLKLIVLFNVGISFCSCLLVSINLEKFEVLAHELEYTNELTITTFDALILFNLVRGRTHQLSMNTRTMWLASLGVVVVGSIAIIQLFIYNFSGWTADGDSLGERTAHYLEFVFGIASAGITFWFTMDNKMTADQRLAQMMYALPHGKPV